MNKKIVLILILIFFVLLITVFIVGCENGVSKASQDEYLKKMCLIECLESVVERSELMLDVGISYEKVSSDAEFDRRACHICCEDSSCASIWLNKTEEKE